MDANQTTEIGARAGLESLNRNPFDADFERRLIFLMPTYEYSCEKCGQNFDAFQSMRDEPFRECPKELCRLPKWGHGKVKRLLGTGAGLIFKGSGFYTTDYRSDSYKEAAKKESPATSSGGEKSTTPKESSKGSSSAQTKTSGKKPAKEAGS
jgi:putative FmdB family regulatory protein